MNSRHHSKFDTADTTVKRFRLKPMIPVVLFSMIFISVQMAGAAEQTYYSIHLASFKHLQNANKKVNSIRQKGKVVFWKKTDIPNRGEFFRVFVGKYHDRNDAIAYWQILKKEGLVKYFGIYAFKETISPPKADPPLRLKQTGEPEKKLKPLLAVPENRFIDNHDGTITDTQTNLMWIKNGWRLEFVSAVTWEQALQKCKTFKLGGYSNWRLSSIKEWKSIIDSQKQSPAIVEPNPFENMIVHLPYWSDTDFVLGGTYTARRAGLPRAYTVMLYSGDIKHQRKNERAFILPVRSIE